MRSFIVLDDEAYVHAGLRALVPALRDAWRYEGGFTDAQALLLALQNKELTPDLIIADIRMPDIDGLEFLRRLRAMGRDTEVILYSGYGEFAYARQALDYQVTAYLLKPLDEDELRSALIKVETRILQKATLQQPEDVSRTLLMRELFGAPPARDNAACRVITRDADSRLLLADILCAPEEDALSLSIQLRKQLCAALSLPGDRAASCLTDGRHIHILFSCPARFLREARYCLSRAAESPRTPALGVSTPQEDMSAFGRMREEAACALAQRALGLRGARFYEAYPASPQPNAYEEALPRAVAEGDREATERLLCAAQAELTDASLPAMRRAATVCALARGLNRAQDAASQIDPGRYEAPQAFMDAVRQAALARIQAAHCQTEQLQNARIQQALRFIDEHLTQELSLPLVAAQAGLSANYFSNLFSKLLGKGFAEHIAEMRIQRAMRLLADTDLRIYAIAEKSGFAEPKYFYRLFRQKTGMTPQRYRAIARQEKPL